VGPRAGLDRCGKSRLHRDSIPGPSVPSPVTTPTELPKSEHYTYAIISSMLNASKYLKLHFRHHRNLVTYPFHGPARFYDIYPESYINM
jgi:hypothetical protein